MIYQLSVRPQKYLIEQLDNGRVLSRLIIDVQDFNQGRFYAIGEKGALEKKVDNYDEGGLLPSRAEDSQTFSGESGIRVQRRPNSTLAFRHFLEGFLKVDQDNVCFFEDANSLIGDKSLNPSLRIFSHEGQVLYMLDSRDIGTKRVLDTIQKSYSWMFVCILTTWSKALETYANNLTLEDLKEIAQNLTSICIGAYDGEGFLVWTHK